MKITKILILTFTVFTSGCASTSFQDFGAKIDDALRGDAAPDSPIQQTETFPGTYPLTINVEPAGSTVKIMNIKPKYHDGIQLEPGSYDVLVRKAGYETYRKYIRVADRMVVRDVILARAQIEQPTDDTVAQAPNGEGGIEPERTATVDKLEVKKPAPEKMGQTDSGQVAKKREPKKVEPEPVAKNDTKTTSDTDNELAKLKADYLPPELITPSELKPADITKDDIPVFDGGYLKAVEEGFFTDDTNFIEVPPAQTFRAILFRAKGDISITWLTRQKKKYFAKDVRQAITMPLEKFKGFLAKGKDNEYVSIHPVERMVIGYAKDGTKSGEKATLFDSNKAVYKGEDLYTYGERIELRKTKSSADSYFYLPKTGIDKGFYVAWYGDKFCFFNLV